MIISRGETYLDPWRNVVGLVGFTNNASEIHLDMKGPGGFLWDIALSGKTTA